MSFLEKNINKGQNFEKVFSLGYFSKKINQKILNKF